MTSSYRDILLRPGSGKKGGKNEETLVEKNLDGRLRSIPAHDIDDKSLRKESKMVQTKKQP